MNTGFQVCHILGMHPVTVSKAVRDRALQSSKTRINKYPLLLYGLMS